MLRRAIASYGDSWYGDGTQVGPYARTILAVDLARAGRTEEAKALAAEVRTLFPGAVEHNGARLAGSLGAEGL